MITHITVEDAAKLISRIAGANEMQALTYIREAADRGEIQTADALEKLQAEHDEMEKHLNEFSEFLCHMTGGLLSKTNYTAQEMISAAEDYQQRVCDNDCDLRADLTRVTAERDAALVDLRKWKVCATCKQYNPHGQKSNCKVKKAYLPGGNWTGCSKWEWKGIKEG